MSESSRKQVADWAGRMLNLMPLELEERIPTLDRPLIIESACPGTQPKWWGAREMYPAEPPGYGGEGGIRFSAVPISIEEQVKANVEACKLGVQALHCHPRDPKTGSSLEMSPVPEDRELHMRLTAQLLGLTLNDVDAIPLQHTFREAGPPPKDFRTEISAALAGGIDFLTELRGLLELGRGNKYVQGVVVLWPPTDSYPPGYARACQEAIRFMEANDIKPIHKLRSSYDVRQLKRVLVDTGVMTKKPFILVHDMGHPFGWPMDIDPWMPMDMIASIEQTKKRIPDSVIGVYSGGRNWMPITMTAILAGVDLIRVGIEDCYWLYPHKDDVIASNTQVVKLIVDFAHMIGRPLATVEQARKIMGIKLSTMN